MGMFDRVLLRIRSKVLTCQLRYNSQTIHIYSKLVFHQIFFGANKMKNLVYHSKKKGFAPRDFVLELALGILVWIFQGKHSLVVGYTFLLSRRRTLLMKPIMKTWKYYISYEKKTKFKKFCQIVMVLKKIEISSEYLDWTIQIP